MEETTLLQSAESLPRYSDAAIGWLGVLLQERFGLEFSLCCESNCWEIALKGALGCLRLRATPETFQRADSALLHTQWNATEEGWQPILDKPLPAPGEQSLPQPLIAATSDGYQIGYDILGLTYWMLTRQEEVGRTDLDEHGRFPATSSHAFKHGYLERPVVDEWLDILGQVIKSTWPGIELKHHAFSVRVSHDVDSPSRYGFRPWKRLPLGMAMDVIKHRDMRGLLAPWIRLKTTKQLHPLDSFNTFDWLMEQSEQHGLVSAFYFICGQQGTPFNADYDVGHPAIRSLIRRIHARGHEIGLHPSYGSYLKPARVLEEAGRLRQVCAEEGVSQKEFGGRMHWLQWQQPDTLRAWDAVGMSYEGTMGYPECPGFRCGSCFEFPAFDPVIQEALTLRVRPLVVMEGSVIAEYGLNLGAGDAASRKMLGLKQSCQRVGGDFSLLWHNSCFVTKEWRDCYMEVLDG